MTRGGSWPPRAIRLVWPREVSKLGLERSSDRRTLARTLRRVVGLVGAVGGGFLRRCAPLPLRPRSVRPEVLSAFADRRGKGKSDFRRLVVQCIGQGVSHGRTLNAFVLDGTRRSPTDPFDPSSHRDREQHTDVRDAASSSRDRRLTNNIGYTPAWSPDGEHIVFSAPGLVIMDQDGSDAKAFPARVGETLSTGPRLTPALLDPSRGSCNARAP